jgi:hypothetical protein
MTTLKMETLMTDAPSLANFDRASVAALSPEARARFTAQLERAGFGKAAVEKALGAPASPPPQNTPPQNPPPPPPPDPAKHGNYSPAEAQRALDSWTKLGLPAESIRAALAAEGFRVERPGRAR